MIEESNDDKVHIDVDICPNCKHPLKFNVFTGKKHCANCGKIWTFEIENDKFIVREWRSVKI